MLNGSPNDSANSIEVLRTKRKYGKALLHGLLIKLCKSELNALISLSLQNFSIQLLTSILMTENGKYMVLASRDRVPKSRLGFRRRTKKQLGKTFGLNLVRELRYSDRNRRSMNEVFNISSTTSNRTQQNISTIYNKERKI